jgi:hypothetical protein
MKVSEALDLDGLGHRQCDPSHGFERGHLGLDVTFPGVGA